jgi:hypothetical protein
MPIYPFERMVYPRRYPSPFVKGRGIRGTGGIGDSIERSEGEKIEGGGTGRKRTRKNGSGTSTVTDIYGPTKGPYVGPAHYIRLQQQEQRQSTGAQAPLYPTPAVPMIQQSQIPPQPTVQEDRSILQAAGGPAMAVHAHFDKMPPETSVYQSAFSAMMLINTLQPSVLNEIRRPMKYSGSRLYLSTSQENRVQVIVWRICTSWLASGSRLLGAGKRMSSGRSMKLRLHLL